MRFKKLSELGNFLNLSSRRKIWNVAVFGMKQHCDIHNTFCTNKGPVAYLVLTLGSQNLT
jgi:hypothetical protein